MVNENLLLSRLPPAVRERLQPRLETVALHKGQTLCKAGDPIRHAYFPTGGVIALEITAIDGYILELATIGRNGMMGVPLVLGDDTLPYRVVVRTKAVALRVPAAVLRAEWQQSTVLHDVLLHYSGHVFRQIAQAGLCHGAHTVLQRLCRWLLTAADHLESDSIEVTHDGLMHALGAARSAVSRAVAELQEGDAIWSRQGGILIRKRQRLELTVCECYQTLREDRRDDRPAPSTSHPRGDAVRRLVRP